MLFKQKKYISHIDKSIHFKIYQYEISPIIKVSYLDVRPSQPHSMHENSQINAMSLSY